jgi:hypothetical protein
LHSGCSTTHHLQPVSFEFAGGQAACGAIVRRHIFSLPTTLARLVGEYGLLPDADSKEADEEKGLDGTGPYELVLTRRWCNSILHLNEPTQPGDLRHLRLGIKPAPDELRVQAAMREPTAWRLPVLIYSTTQCST